MGLGVVLLWKRHNRSTWFSLQLVIFCSSMYQLIEYWWLGFLGFPYERGCYFGITIESQTTGPKPSWWLNQPIWKMWSSQIGSSPQVLGAKIKKHMKPPTLDDLLLNPSGSVLFWFVIDLLIEPCWAPNHKFTSWMSYLHQLQLSLELTLCLLQLHFFGLPTRWSVWVDMMTWEIHMATQTKIRIH